MPSGTSPLGVPAAQTARGRQGLADSLPVAQARQERAQGLSRRRLLQIGGLGAFGLNLPRLPAAGARGPKTRPRMCRGRRTAPAGKTIKSCILLFYYGGPSHHDTWDMKLSAPREVRGDLRDLDQRAGAVDLRALATVGPGDGQDGRDSVDASPDVQPQRRGGRSPCGQPLKGDLELLANDPTDRFPVLRIRAPVSSPRAAWCRPAWRCRTSCTTW